MLKIALLHGAIENAGDFLILDRTKKLLTHFYPSCEINLFFRNTYLDDQLPEINSNHILIFAGGPGYKNEFYEDNLFEIHNLSRIKIPIMFLGMGWFGIMEDPFFLYTYELQGKMKDLLARAVHDTRFLGCRDYYSVNMLRNNGIDTALMTGCPAWYDLDHLHEFTYTGKELKDVSKICISDCGNPENNQLALELTLFVCRFFGNKDIHFIFHRGLENVDSEFLKILTANNIQYHDISGSVDGFQLYDDCDLHIGFRVHAHIYSLSKRKMSVLIEEDARGVGVNDALGLPHIKVHQPILNGTKLQRISNKYFCLQLEDCLMNYAHTNYAKLDTAFHSMNKHFALMEQHIKSIQNYI